MREEEEEIEERYLKINKYDYQLFCQAREKERNETKYEEWNEPKLNKAYHLKTYVHILVISRNRNLINIIIIIISVFYQIVIYR